MASVDEQASEQTTEQQSEQTTTQQRLDADVAHVGSMYVAKNTKVRYGRNVVNFMRYMHRAEQRAAHPEYFDEHTLDEQGRPRVKLAEIPVAEFKRFFMWRRNNGLRDLNTREGIHGKRRYSEAGPGTSTLGLDRSAIVDLYKQKGVALPLNFEEDMRLFFRGLKRQVTNQRYRGQRRATEGKEAFSFHFFTQFSVHSIQHREPFGHTYSALMWNIMCRTNNVAALLYSNIYWQNDSLLVVLPKLKSDPEGTRDKDAKHLYANPFCPEVCCVLALGIYLACHPELGVNDDGVAQYLFTNPDNPTTRFQKVLEAFKATAFGKAEMKRDGLEVVDVGAHSWRKSSSSYVNGGSAGGGPTGAAVCLRGDWELKGVQDRYWRYEVRGSE
jgi:hypothetical protein